MKKVFLTMIIVGLGIFGTRELTSKRISCASTRRMLKNRNIYDACTWVASEYYKVDKEDAKNNYNRLIREIEQKLAGNHNVSYVIEQINHQLYVNYNIKSVSTATNYNFTLPNLALKNRTGSCLSLSLLYISIAEDLGVNLYGILLPGHIYIAYSDKEIQLNIETTCGGVHVSDKDYSKMLSPRSKKCRVYLTKLSKEQLFAVFLNGLASCLKAENRHKEALDIYKVASQLFPEFAEIYVNIGSANLSLKNYKKAKKNFLKARYHNNFIWQTESNLAKIYLKEANYAKAIVSYQQAIEFLLEVAPLSVVLQNMPDQNEIDAVIEDFLALDKLDIAKGNALALHCLRMNNTKLAIKILQKVIQQWPDDFMVRNLLTIALLRDRQYGLIPKFPPSDGSTQRPDFRYGFDSFPRDAGILYKELGIALYHNQDYEAAIESLGVSVNINGKDADTKFLINECHLKLQNGSIPQ